jgi:uncharacterized protein
MKFKLLSQKKILATFFQGKIILLVGARQVGKTTLAETMLSDYAPDRIQKFNCDDPADRELLDSKDLTFLNKLIGSKDIIFIDEGQKVGTIGQVERYGKILLSSNV